MHSDARRRLGLTHLLAFTRTQRTLMCSSTHTVWLMSNVGSHNWSMTLHSHSHVFSPPVCEPFAHLVRCIMLNVTQNHTMMNCVNHLTLFNTCLPYLCRHMCLHVLSGCLCTVSRTQSGFCQTWVHMLDPRHHNSHGHTMSHYVTPLFQHQSSVTVFVSPHRHYHHQPIDMWSQSHHTFLTSMSHCWRIGDLDGDILLMLSGAFQILQLISFFSSIGFLSLQ